MDAGNSLTEHLAQQTIYLMGASFIIGSLFTIFILLILDMLRLIYTRQQENMGSEAADEDYTESAVETEE